VASAGLAAIGRYKLAGIVPVAEIFSLSRKLGDRMAVAQYTPGEAL
jgi:hypothetical protein